MIEVHGLLYGLQEVEHLQGNFSSEVVGEMVFDPLQDSIYLSGVVLVYHRFGVLEPVGSVGHQTFVFGKPRL
jgi:hypothetical protein